MSATTVDDRARYRANPSVLTALKNPRMLTREVLAGLVVGLALGGVEAHLVPQL